MDKGRLMSVNEAADEFWLEPTTVRKWIQRRYVGWAAPGFVWEFDVADAERATRRRPRVERLNEIAKEEA